MQRSGFFRTMISCFVFISGLSVLLNYNLAEAEGDIAVGVTRAADYDNNTRLFYMPINSGGTLGNPVSIDTEYGFTNGNGVAVADFDKDGDLDVILNHGKSGGYFHLYRRNGQNSSSFTESAVIDSNLGTLSGTGQNIAVGYFNNDTNMDFAYGNGGGLKVCLGNGNGTFVCSAAGSSLPENAFMLDMDAGDVNSDGYADIVTASIRGDYMDHNELWVWTGNGNGTFNAPNKIYDGYDTNGDPNWNAFGAGVVVQNFDGDCFEDVLFTAEPSGEEYVSRNYVATGNGNGTFNTPTPWVGALSDAYMHNARYPFVSSSSCPDVITAKGNYWTSEAIVWKANCSFEYQGAQVKNTNNYFDPVDIATPRW